MMRAERHAASTAILASCLALAGCGGDSLGSTRTPSTDGGLRADASAPRDASTHEPDAPPLVLSSAREITSFTLTAANNPALDDDAVGAIAGTDITLTVPADVDLAALTPTVELTGITLSPESDVETDFSDPVAYTVTAEDGSTQVYTVAVEVERDCTATVPVCDRAVYDRARAYAAAHPTYDGGSWSGHCGSLMFRFGGFTRSASTASLARAASTIVSTNAATAPVGAFHWWDLGTPGHVGVDVLGGGGTVFMASRYLAESWAPAIGVNSVAGYNRSAPGAVYRGWSRDYVGQRLSGGGATSCGPTIVPEGCPVPPTPTERTGEPDGLFWLRMQMYAASHGYTGPLNGIMGPNSWAGVQRGLRSAGYTGPDNGIPGENTYMAMQRIASDHGYTGPVNGILGPNSYRGFAKFLNDTY